MTMFEDGLSKDGRFDPYIEIIFGIVFLIGVFLILCLTPYACNSPSDARRVLEQNGYTQVKITGYRWFACGEDAFSTGFEAVNANGKHVTGVVCSGFLKNSTIRFD